MSIADPSSTASTSEDPRAAFREVHGRTLHGFALLLALGNRAVAARLASTALADGIRHGLGDAHPELRHPERGAAWLRGEVLRSLPRRLERPSPAEERIALDALGADATLVERLARLSARERAAVIAADIEHMDPRDVETVVGRTAASLERLLVGARRRYLEAVGPIDAADAAPTGPLVDRVRAIARRTMA